jgi:hypothetical protein
MLACITRLTKKIRQKYGHRFYKTGMALNKLRFLVRTGTGTDKKKIMKKRLATIEKRESVLQQEVAGIVYR